ncbi:MAG: SH3 domain-containing protein [Opitutaceae bacterium]
METVFGEAGAEAFLCEPVLEHLTLEEGAIAAGTLFEYLKPGGFARIAVPDRHFPDEDYQRMVRPGGPGPSDHPAADHKIVYGYRELTRVFENAGFEVRLLEYHDENGNFQLHDWDPDIAPVYRSSKLDSRNQNGRIVTHHRRSQTAGIMNAASTHIRSFESAPRVHEGEKVVFERFDSRNPAWFFGRDPNAVEGYFPTDWFLINQADGTATARRSYDGMELSVSAGDAIALEEEYGGWVLVTSGEHRGWIPKACLPPENLPSHRPDR